MACCSRPLRKRCDHRRRSQTPRRTRWHDQRAAYLGVGTDASSAHPHDRSRRWAVARWQPLGRVQAGVLSCTCGCCRALFDACSLKGCWLCTVRANSLLRRSDWRWRTLSFSQLARPFRKNEWVVYAKPPFGGPEAVLAYLSRYTHRVAISNSRLISADAKPSRSSGKITASNRRPPISHAPCTSEFIRRFLIHVLPDGSTASVTMACSPAPPARPI